MKQWEIIKAAQEEGARIRGKQWSPNSFIQWDGKHWIDEDGELCGSTAIGNHWELYIEPIRTFGPDRAMYWLGKYEKVKRKAWTGAQWIERHANEHTDEKRRVFPRIDWFHNDWHLCDENGNYAPEPEEGK